MNVQEAEKQIRDNYTGNPNHEPNPAIVVSFIQNNWFALTGMGKDEMYAEQEFADEVLELADIFDIEYEELCILW